MKKIGQGRKKLNFFVDSRRNPCESPPDMKTNTATPATEFPHVNSIKPGCYAVILATGKAGKITGKGFGRFDWGMSWSHDEYKQAPAWKTEGFEANEIRRITPAQYHALPESRKITAYGQD